MTLYAVIFYVLAAMIVVTTAIAITRRQLVHAVVFLVFSFFGSALLFYLFGAPLLAALEVIIYAGAIMVLFLFVVIMLDIPSADKRILPMRQWIPAGLFGAAFLAIGAVLVWRDPQSREMLTTARAEPAEFGRFLFQQHWLSIELVSLLLLVVVVGALLLGRRFRKQAFEEGEEST